MAPAYKLTYFNIRGLAEVSRFLMKYGDIEFEDDRFTKEEWQELKPKMPFGQVPILTANGKEYHQSMAIARFLARKVKLAGDNEWEELEIDSMVDTYTDLRLKILLYCYEPDPVIKESRKDPLFNEILPYYLTRLDQIAKDNNGHLACKKLTWADMYFASLLESLNDRIGMDIIAEYPNLQAVQKNVFEIPAIKKWLETRPEALY